MKENIIVHAQQIQNHIYTIRNQQVMMDTDLAELYGVETKQLNRAVSRNIDRFPERFRFQLSKEEHENFLRFQNGTLKENLDEDQRGKHRKYMPYAFTEQGVSMLSAVLRSKIAVEVSIKIIDSFVEMRKFVTQNALLFQKIEIIEKKQQKTDERLEKVLNAIDNNDVKPKQGVFFNGQIFDAYVLMSSLIKEAKRSVVLIDNYIDETTLVHLSNKAPKGVSITILTKVISKGLKLDLEKHNEQYNHIKIKELKHSHDRFLLIDEKIYHLGASLKDLGKKWFAFSLMEEDAFELKRKIGEVLDGK